MATLNNINGINDARARADIPLGPTEDDPDSVALTTSQRFEIGRRGDSFVAVANGEYHLVCGDENVVATTAAPGPWSAGAVRLVLPDGCTHVAMIEGAAGAALGCAYPG